MTATRQLVFWGIGIVLLGLALQVLSPILLPFVVGVAVAYFLDPAVLWLGRRKVNRTLATVLILTLFFGAIIVALAFIAPLVQSQVVGFIKQAPELFRALQDRALRLLARASQELSPENVEQLKAAAGGLAGNALKFAGEIATRLWAGGLAFLNLLSLVFISPVVAFYVLRDWDRIVARVDNWLPREHASTIRRLVAEADAMIAGYVRGISTVCIVLAIFYGVALTLIGLDFGLVIGLMSGLISFIPFVGAAVGFVVGVGVAVVQFGEVMPVAITAAVFVAGQVLEGNVLTPKLVGDRIQLHPVWVIFALLAGGLLFGFVGVLLAVPVAAVVGVLARFFIGEYLKSRIYRGGDGPGA
ncbi:MAG: AI-2E family transporter [Alphaproteobacteria bacterium]|nr:AI-2E family transporter [Alphaproteobacteria bacterium]